MTARPGTPRTTAARSPTGATASPTRSPPARAATPPACPGPASTDFDLYLDKNVGGRWTTVARSTGETSREAITYTGTAGTYRYRIVSYSGSGNAVLGWNAPAPQ